MQAELRSTYPLLEIEVIGVNEFGHESANDLMTDGRDTPWLQDTDTDGNQASDVWSESWDVVFRDVVILNGENEAVDNYNLTINNLADSDSYAELRDKLLDTAMIDQTPYYNATNPVDVNNDGLVVPLDALFLVNSIEDEGSRQLAPPTGTSIEYYYDCTGDGFLAPVDVLQVVNAIEAQPDAEAEGAVVAFDHAVTCPSEEASTDDALPKSGSSKVLPGVPLSTGLESHSVATQQRMSPDSRHPVTAALDDFWAEFTRL